MIEKKILNVGSSMGIVLPVNLLRAIRWRIGDTIIIELQYDRKGNEPYLVLRKK